jgi:hypothetical protein
MGHALLEQDEIDSGVERFAAAVSSFDEKAVPTARWLALSR